MIAEIFQCKIIKRNLIANAFIYCPKFHKKKKKYSEIFDCHDINFAITKSKWKRGKTTYLDITNSNILTVLK